MILLQILKTCFEIKKFNIIQHIYQDYLDNFGRLILLKENILDLFEATKYVVFSTNINFEKKTKLRFTKPFPILQPVLRCTYPKDRQSTLHLILPYQKLKLKVSKLFKTFLSSESIHFFLNFFGMSHLDTLILPLYFI